MMIKSIRLRLTLWYAIALAVVLILFAAGTFLYVRDNLYTQIESQLDAELRLIQQTLDKSLDEYKELELHGFLHLFKIEEDNWPIYISSAWDDADLNYALIDAPYAARWIWLSSSGEYFHVKRLRVSQAGHQFVLTVALNSDQIHLSLRRLLIAFLIAAPLGVLIGLLGGYILAGRVLSPIQQIAVRAKNIGAENLSERLTFQNEKDELGQLTIVLNNMFARLEASFNQLRRFTQDAAHELRTPLAVLRGVGEVGLQENRDAQSYRDIIGSMLEETDRLGKLVDGLLTLARAESGRIVIHRSMIDISELSRDVVDFLHVLAEDKQQTLQHLMANPIMIEIDSELLRLALINIISNAIRFTPGGGNIVVRSLDKVSYVVVEVQDNGPGIAKEHHARLFERFYRIDRSHSQETGGTGLGLAIALWAVEANKGRIELVSEPGQGSLFRIIIPR